MASAPQKLFRMEADAVPPRTGVPAALISDTNSTFGAPPSVVSKNGRARIGVPNPVALKSFDMLRQEEAAAFDAEAVVVAEPIAGHEAAAGTNRGVVVGAAEQDDGAGRSLRAGREAGREVADRPLG